PDRVVAARGRLEDRDLCRDRLAGAAGVEQPREAGHVIAAGGIGDDAVAGRRELTERRPAAARRHAGVKALERDDLVAGRGRVRIALVADAVAVLVALHHARERRTQIADI